MKPLLPFLLCLLSLSLFSQNISVQLNEVTIEAGENPAHRIVDSVMAHLQENNPNALDSYRYEIYDQMVVTIDDETGTRLDSLLLKSDLMVMETFSEVLFRAPNQLRQNVLGTKMSGSKDPQVVYLASKMQSTSFYDEKVNIAGTDYVNPISRNSKSHYFFNLDTVQPAGGTDSLYLISFHPIKGSAFSGIRGTLTIHSDGWALREVTAEPDKQGGFYTIGIQQHYQKVEGRWFPKQLNTKLIVSKAAAEVDGHTFPLTAVGKSTISNVVLHPKLERNAFSEIEVMVDRNAGYRDDAFWTQHRIDSLTERILNTYHLVDSLTHGSDIIDRMLNLGNKLIDETALGLGPVDWNIGRSLRISGYRGLYLALDFSTNDRLSRYFRLRAFGGYWTRLKDFDYGFEGKWLIDRQHQMELGVRYNHRSSAVGEFSNFDENAGVLSEINYRFTFYENVLARGNTFEAFYNTRFARYFKAFLTFGSYHKKYALEPFDTLPMARYTNAGLLLRFAYDEKFTSTPQGLRSMGTDWPIVWLSYQHSFKGPLGGEFEYDRVKFQVEKVFQTKYIGQLSVLLQAGYASASAPVTESFSILGSYSRVGLYSPGSFATMRENEFFCDHFVSLFLWHDFQGSLWDPGLRWFKPQLTLSTAVGWGYPSMTQGYFESGFVVKGLLSLPMVDLGAGVFYRYGPYACPNIMDNVAFKYSITFGL